MKFIVKTVMYVALLMQDIFNDIMVFLYGFGLPSVLVKLNMTFCFKYIMTSGSGFYFPHFI